MQVTDNSITLETASTDSPSILISAKVIAYVVLILGALVLRLAQIDAVPMTDYEAREALYAYQFYNPYTPAEAPLMDSAVKFWLQSTAYNFLGGNELAARLGGLVGGVLLTLMPILFISFVGWGRAFVMSLIFAFSPIAILSSRSFDSSVWVVLFAMGLWWATWSYWQGRRFRDVFWTTFFAVGLVFLAGSSGLILALIISLALGLALWRTAFHAPQEYDLSGEEYLQNVREAVKQYPFMKASLIGVGILFIAGTGMMIFPEGLSLVGQNLIKAIEGFWQARIDSQASAFAVRVLIVYEVFMLVFAFIAYWAMRRADRVGLADRFAGFWFLLALLLLLFYQGATGAFALWFIVPLAWFTSYFVMLVISDRPVSVFWGDRFYDDEDSSRRYFWVKWLLAILTVLLLVTLVTHMQEIGRGLLQISADKNFNDTITYIFEAGMSTFRYSVVWFVITVLFLVVGFFLAASIWGNVASLQGLGLGLFIFTMITGAGLGWNAATNNAKLATELWYTGEGAVQADAVLLRKTLYEVAQRNSQGFPLIEMAIVEDETQGITPDSVVAWLVRDFNNARFVKSTEDAQRSGIILMAKPEGEVELGGDYVGQGFRLREQWEVESLQAKQVPAWWLQRRLETKQFEKDESVLWLRMDVYHGVPLEGLN